MLRTRGNVLNYFPNEQSLIFSYSDNITEIINRKSVAQSMFLVWIDANKKYPGGRNLTYAEYPTKFVWKLNSREWLPRKQGFAIGRIYHVPSESGDVYYLRCLLSKVLRA